MSIELKVKAKVLAEEARIIRKEERKAKAKASWEKLKQNFRQARVEYDTLESLNCHRKFVVRPEARATHLARAYISGKTYEEVEATCRKPLPHRTKQRIVYMINKYHDYTVNYKNVADWIKGKNV